MLSGTPTSTTTSLSALSTTAIKDGHRGHLPGGPLGRGHQHTSSTTSLEAERADRISRLAGLERVSTLRAPMQQSQGQGQGHGQGGGGSGAGGAPSLSPQTTPTSTTGFPANFPASHNLTPSYFDTNGQPVAVTKMSTVGSASATESHPGEGDESRQTIGDHEEDMFSDTNYREAGSVASMAAEPDAMDEDMDGEGLATQSVGGYEDRMSDDGSASLVGFGEGANSTVSGPIYQRRAIPSASQAQQPPWTTERSASGLSDLRRGDVVMGGGDTPASGSAQALQERRDARMIDGVATDPTHPALAPEQEPYVDTTFTGPIHATRSQTRDAEQRRDWEDRRED